MSSLASGMKNQVRPNHLRRLSGLAALFSLILAGLGFRLVDLQVFQHERYKALAQKNTQRIFLTEPRRGDILDAHGNPLATSVPVKKICADPYFIGPFAQEVARSVGPQLDLDADELAARIQPRGITNYAGKVIPLRYVDLRRKIPVEDWETLEQTMTNLVLNPMEHRLPRAQRKFYEALRHKAIYAVDDQLRYYPNGPLAAHVLGFAQFREQDFNATSVTEIFGRSGVERWFNDQMAGARGWRITEVDRRRRELVAYREQHVDPRPGLNAVLTLDIMVQSIVEEELRRVMADLNPVSASSIVLRPRTGEILAMASLPSFDPNQPGESDVDHRRDRIIADRMEPGSTFKIITVAAALNEGVASLEDPIDCENGFWMFKGRPLRDAGSHHYGRLSVQEVLAKSSNIGAAKIALRLGEQRFRHYATAFGFGSRTSIGLPGEDPGLVPALKDWDGLTITRMPMGHSVAVTHLQMILAVAAIANDGWLMRPMIVRRLVDDQGNVFVDYPPQPVRQVVSEQAARLTTRALKTVVAEGGTAVRASLEHYTVAGKTGTAQKPDLVHGGYLDKDSIHSFIGYFPADAPELCISVVIDAPKNKRFASSTAVPAFQRIAELVARYLKVRPDRDMTRNETDADPDAGRGRLAALPPDASHPSP